MPKKRTIQSNPYLAKNARCRFQWLITKGLAGRGFKNGYCTPNGYTLTSVLITAVLIGIIAVPLMKLSMQTGRIQLRSLNREKARQKALSISQVGKKSNDISEVEALASEKGCTLEGDNGSYLATCTVGATKQSLGTGSKAFVLCEASSDSGNNQLSELMKKVKPGREIYKGESNYYTIVDGPTWEEAETNAVNLGGHLVTINDASENGWLISTFRDANTTYFPPGSADEDIYWIGLTQTNGSWKWSDGSQPGYFNWGKMAPYGNGNRGHMILEADPNAPSWLWSSEAGKWNDQYSSYATSGGYGHHGIAEIPRNSASNENDAQNCEG